MPLVRIREKAQVTLPSKVMRDHDLRVGDMVDVEVSGNTLRLTPKSAVDRDIIQGRSDREAGRGKEFASAEEMLAYLRKSPKSQARRHGKR